jgi:hypothetical protein
VSLVAASGALVPPCAWTVLLSRTPNTGKLPFAMNAGSGADLCTTTVAGSGVSTLVMPSSKKDGLPLMAMARSSDHFTSVEVIALPELWNLTPWRRWNVKVRASGLTSHVSARSGTIWLMSCSSSVTRVL